MGKTLKVIDLSDTLHLAECTDGFWLYDDTRGWNIAMRAKTEREAFCSALKYYQNTLKEVENNYNSLKAKVDHFVGQVADGEDDYHYCERCGTSS